MIGPFDEDQETVTDGIPVIHRRRSYGFIRRYRSAVLVKGFETYSATAALIGA